MKKVTLDSIADQLAVSKFAVSRALAGKDGVGDELRLRIITKAREMGYQRSSATVPTQPIIHVIFAEHDPVNSELWMQMQNGIEQEASAAGFQLQTIWAPSSDKVSGMVANSNGVVLVGPHEQPLIEAIAATGRTTVRLGWVRPLENTDQIGGADHEAGKAVGEYLLARGHRKITFVHGTRKLRGRMERLFGLREATVYCPDATISEIQFSTEKTFAQHITEMADLGDLPTALFCSHDSLAVFVIAELHRIGYRVPQDISVMGYGDFTAATQISPALTTLRLPGTDMGIAAFRLLMDRMNTRKRQLPPQRVMLVPTLIERESVRDLMVLSD